MKHYSKEQISILKTIAGGPVDLSGHENDLSYMKQYRFLCQVCAISVSKTIWHKVFCERIRRH